jgi:signal transduction histidine kinase
MPGAAKGRSSTRTGHTRRVPAADPYSLLPAVDDLPGSLARVSGWLDRVGMRTPVQRDDAGAVAWSVLSAAVLLLLLGPMVATEQIRLQPEQVALIVGLGAVQCLILVVRRIHPIVCLLAVSTVQVVFSAALPPDVGLQSAAPVVAAYTAGLMLAPRPLMGALALSLVVQAVGASVASAAGLSPGREPLGVAAGIGDGLLATGSAALLAVAAASVGAWIALRRDQRRSIRARAAATVEHQAVRTSAAVAAERTRMARELHDIAAHHLSALIIQASAAERLVDTDPERAKQTIREVRGQGRETLDDMRSIVGILRDTEGDAPRADGNAPIPGLEQLETLIDAARTSGDRITWRASGPTIVLPPLADVTTYRVAQEALANARRHSPTAPVTVVMVTTPTRLVLVVENALAPDETVAGGADSASVRAWSAAGSGAPGHGLLGMRERAALVGATLTVGATADDTWRVTFDLPIDDDASGTIAPAGDAS